MINELLLPTEHTTTLTTNTNTYTTTTRNEHGKFCESACVTYQWSCAVPSSALSLLIFWLAVPGLARPCPAWPRRAWPRLAVLTSEGPRFRQAWPSYLGPDPCTSPGFKTRYTLQDIRVTVSNYNVMTTQKIDRLKPGFLSDWGQNTYPCFHLPSESTILSVSRFNSIPTAKQTPAIVLSGLVHHSSLHTYAVFLPHSMIIFRDSGKDNSNQRI